MGLPIPRHPHLLSLLNCYLVEATSPEGLLTGALFGRQRRLCSWPSVAWTTAIRHTTAGSCVLCSLANSHFMRQFKILLSFRLLVVLNIFLYLFLFLCIYVVTTLKRENLRGRRHEAWNINAFGNGRSQNSAFLFNQ